MFTRRSKAKTIAMRGSMDKQQILIVDDEPLVISELVGFLSDESYKVFTAENGS